MAIECKRSTVIAKLMGLDSQPDKPPPSVVKRCIAHDLHAKPVVHDPIQCHETRRDRRLSDIMSPPRRLSLHAGVGGEHTEGKDICQVQQEVSSSGDTVDVPVSVGNRNDGTNDRADDKKRMEHVLDNFMEAKRLSLNNKDLLQSKEFSDALEVLSSNCDLFLEFLRDPNSQISRHLQGVQRAHHSSQSDRSTLPRPNRCAMTAGGVESIDVDHVAFEGKFRPKTTNRLRQATRIVVLKPGLGRNNHLNNEVVRSTSLPSALEGSHPLEALTTNESRGAREVAKRITCQMQETLSRNSNDNNNKRSETLSCLLSKECADDSSLLEGSEKEYTEEECASPAARSADPTSQGSWDYVNRRGSHYTASSSSLTQATSTQLPESSIFRDARRRLSERWLLVTSSKLNQEQKRTVSRSSSTLAEILSVSDKGEATDGDDNGPAGTRAYRSEVDGVEEFPRNLPKSNSVPQSSSTIEPDGFHDEYVLCFHVSSSVHAAAGAAANKPPPKSSMSFLKGRVSSLFLSRKRKDSRERSPRSLSPENNHSGGIPCCDGYYHHYSSDCSCRKSPICSQNTFAGGDPLNTEQDDATKSETSLTKERLPLEKLLALESSNEEQEQPSPVSVLQAPFEVDSVSSSWSQSLVDEGSHELHHECQDAASLPDTVEAATASGRCLTFEEDESGSTSDNVGEAVCVDSDFGDVVDGRCEEWMEFVKLVLSCSGYRGGETSMTMLRRWHSAESPLDPALLGKLLAGPKTEEEVQEERGCVERLLFDCVNVTLSEICKTGLVEAACPLLGSCPKAAGTRRRALHSTTSLASQVICHVKELLCPEEVWLGDQDHAALMASVTREQAADSGWAREMNLEVAELGAEIQRLVLDELVVEVVGDVLLGCLV